MNNNDFMSLFFLLKNKKVEIVNVLLYEPAIQKIKNFKFYVKTKST